MRTTLALALAFALSTIAVLASEGQQTTAPRPSSLTIESMAGHDSFAFYCASCHGAQGKGDGPTAAAMKISPPDLTLLARRRGGTFPRAEVEVFVASGGRPIPSHGSSEMPVWGPIFRSLDPSDVRTRVRIANLVAYLESIQTK